MFSDSDFENPKSIGNHSLSFSLDVFGEVRKLIGEDEDEPQAPPSEAPSPPKRYRRVDAGCDKRIAEEDDVEEVSRYLLQAPPKLPMEELPNFWSNQVSRLLIAPSPTSLLYFINFTT